ncbi:MAG: amidohydrolase family protein, partial [Spirochaetales bacterium]|nr:amidohydrolase family protein [Spirochaetales bacterium]
MIIKNCRYLDWKDLSFASCDLVVEEGRGGGLEKSGVKSVAGMGSGQKKGGVEIDAGGRIVTRAFGCGHHHIYSALARGMPAPGKPPVDFVGILRNIWWVLDRSLDTDMIRASAETTALDLIRNGCSLVIDHHASPFSCEGSLQIIHEVLERTGLNHVLCYEMSDRDGDKAARQGLAESEAYLKSGNPALVGLHASFTVENWLYEAALDLAGRYHSGIHIHAAEGLYDVLYCLKRYGITLAERLAPVLAMDKSIVVHCIHFDDQEREMLAAGRAWIA